MAFLLLLLLRYCVRSNSKYILLHAHFYHNIWNIETVSVTRTICHGQMEFCVYHSPKQNVNVKKTNHSPVQIMRCYMSCLLPTSNNKNKTLLVVREKKNDRELSSNTLSAFNLTQQINTN